MGHNIRLNISAHYFLFLVSAILIGASFVANDTYFRYVRYFAFVPMLPLANKVVKNGYLKGIIGVFTVFILYGTLLYLFRFSFSLRIFQEFLLVLSPLIFLVVTASTGEINKRHIKILFYAIGTLFIIENIQDVFTILFAPKILIEGLLTSRLSTESHFGFFFGLSFVFFVLEKEKKWLIFLSALLLLLALKRIAVGAVCLSLAFYFLSYKGAFGQKRKLYLNLIVLTFLMFFIFLLIGLSKGDFDEAIKAYTGFSSNQFTMGRVRLYSTILENFETSFFGYGLGSITIFVTEMDVVVNRLHSDVLRLFLELGWGFYGIWIVWFNYLNIFNLKSAVMLIFYWIIMATDNAFIYFDFLTMFYLIQAYFYGHKHRS